jgi:hypothetical protein
MLSEKGWNKHGIRHDIPSIGHSEHFDFGADAMLADVEVRKLR